MFCFSSPSLFASCLWIRTSSLESPIHISYCIPIYSGTPNQLVSQFYQVNPYMNPWFPILTKLIVQVFIMFDDHFFIVCFEVVFCCVQNPPGSSTHLVSTGQPRWCLGSAQLMSTLGRDVSVAGIGECGELWWWWGDITHDGSIGSWGGSTNGGHPKCLVYSGTSHEKMDDLGVIPYP